MRAGEAEGAPKVGHEDGEEGLAGGNTVPGNEDAAVVVGVGVVLETKGDAQVDGASGDVEERLEEERRAGTAVHARVIVGGCVLDGEAEAGEAEDES